MKKNKVIHIVPSMQLGGVEKGINLSINKLNQEFDYKVITLTNENSYYSKEDAKHFFFSKKKFVIFSIISCLLRIIKEKPDIIVSSLWKSSIITIIYKKFINKNVNLVAFIHSEIYFHKLDKVFSNMLLQTADAVACDSLNTLESVKSRTKAKKKYYVIPYIFPSQTSYIAKSNFEVVKFLYAGRLNEIKNLEATLDFFFEFKKKQIPFIFNIYGVGNEEYKTKLVQKIQKLGLENEVYFKGLFQPNETSIIYSFHHFYIQFSRQEGMAMSVVDAMLNGVVPICTPVGEIRNYVKDLDNGILINLEFLNENFIKTTEILQNVIKNKNEYNNLSNSAYNYFQSKKNYVQSFIEMVNELDNNKLN